MSAIKFILSGGDKCPSDVGKCREDRLSKTQLSDYTEATNLNIFDTQTTKGKRNPSYCDRILYRFKQMNNDIEVEQTAYKSFTNDIIAESDHDMVYATYQVKNKEGNKLLDILFITWNQENMDVKVDDVFKGFEDFNNYDIVILSQQESNRNDSLQSSLIDKYINTHRIFKDSVGGGILVDPITGHFYVRVTVLLKKETVNVSIYNKSSYACLGSATYPFSCTKSIVGVGVSIKLDSKEFLLNVFGCHMPIDTSKENLGYEERVTAYKAMETQMQTFSQIGVGKFVAELDIIGGDMNFRYNSGIDGDQLIEGMKKGEIFSAFKEGEITFGPTCKMCICKEKKEQKEEEYLDPIKNPQ